MKARDPAARRRTTDAAGSTFGTGLSDVTDPDISGVMVGVIGATVGTVPEVAAGSIEELYRREAAPLLAMLWIYTGDRGAAEDLVQEAFARVHVAWPRLHEDGNPAAYLRSTAFNLARSRFRRLRTARAYVPPRPADEGSPEDALVLHEGQREVLAAVRRLSGRQRECVLLRYYAGLSETEVAQALEVSVSSVRTHVRRALAVLEADLGGGR